MSAEPRGGGPRECASVVFGYVLLTVFLTSPLAFQLGSVARLDNADARQLIWNVSWVARTLIVDPLHVFDANIFYPHRWTLAYTESNLGAGVLAIPVYWATRNPYATYNFVICLSFVLTATGMYYLVRYLTADRAAAAIAAVCFAFCPYVFSHLPQIHLLMTVGLPWSMLAFHRLADRPTWGRGAVLGLAGAAQAFLCGYYAVFVALTVGCAVLIVTLTTRRWVDRRYWGALTTAVLVAAALAIPLFVPYLRLQRETGFSRPVDDARLFSATWRTYFASSAYMHAWLLPLIGRWNEVLFPGFVGLIGGVAGAVVGWREHDRFRQIVVVYVSLTVLAYWASLGPDAGLYSVLSAAAPAVFSFMRAPSRLGVVVAFALAVLAGVCLSVLFDRLARPSIVAGASEAGRPRSRRGAVAALLAIAAVGELKVPLVFSRVPPVEPAYQVLAKLPRGPVLELPFFSARYAANRTQYMLNSTAHWMPLVNGYSSYTPADFFEKTDTLAGFPSLEAFKALEPDRVRYAVFHTDGFSPGVWEDIAARLRTFDRYLVRRYADDRIWLFEIVEFPA